ncbi:hypothetical protein CKA32_002798 [Geitlerinema sp. FC II]|nr:hypothetical protein CKA32_002798 [Geitlerinema sp. FC II]
MNRDDIKTRLKANLEAANCAIEEIRVQPDPFSGWRIVVISPNFADRSNIERRQIALKGLETLEIEWLDVLTPEEREWAGKLPTDSDLEDLPLWPEALARGQNIPKTVVFPSDLDDDLEPPIVATFYSLRGGVGRSTALAYTAQILARRGRTVLCVDLDLEAPGLAALFGREAEIQPGQGVLPSLVALDRGEDPDLQSQILRLSELDELYCLPAGKPDANYARLLNFVDPAAWYREDSNPLRELLDRLSSSLSFKPEIVLFDARTGITPLNAPLLFDLADVAIVTFFPHPQAQTGIEALVRALLASRTRRTGNLAPEPRFVVSPIPASKAPEVVERYQHRAIEWISQWLDRLTEQRPDAPAIDETEITHFVPYRDVIATSDGVSGDRDLWKDYEAIAEWIEFFLPTRSEQQLARLSKQLNLPQLKPQILEELNFSSGTAEHQQNFLETFVPTDIINRALRPEIPLIRGRKGSGKTAIFRRITEDDRRSRVVVMSPNPLKDDRFWILTPEGFKEIDRDLQKLSKSWRDFWLLEICISCYSSLNNFLKKNRQSILGDRLNKLPQETVFSELDFIQYVSELLSLDRLGLLAQDWLQKLDCQLSNNTLLLFDGLDTSFGNGDAARKRRTQAIEALLSLVIEFGDSLQNLRFKILLREDIWRQLKFGNKSHFYGRSIVLTWSNRTDFFKIAIKQAVRSNTFKNLVRSTLEYTSIFTNTSLENIDYWSEEQVKQVWNLLVGERMRGGKSAFTQNWVWNRLTDANEERSPRFLLRLFQEAKEWETREYTQESQNQSKEPNHKTLIRPRALSESLPKVSEAALSALIQEEFTELEPLTDRLKSIGRSPVEAGELKDKDLEEQVNLAREVGLLSVYEEIDGRVQRYKVPDLYRLGLRMTRSGQA